MLNNQDRKTVLNDGAGIITKNETTVIQLGKITLEY